MHCTALHRPAGRTAQQAVQVLRSIHRLLVVCGCLECIYASLLGAYTDYCVITIVTTEAGIVAGILGTGWNEDQGEMSSIDSAD